MEMMSGSREWEACGADDVSRQERGADRIGPARAPLRVAAVSAQGLREVRAWNCPGRQGPPARRSRRILRVSLQARGERIGRYLAFYNDERAHQVLAYQLLRGAIGAVRDRRCAGGRRELRRPRVAARVADDEDAIGPQIPMTDATRMGDCPSNTHR
jgi:hypothetical protein